MADPLIEALRTGKLAEVRAALGDNPKLAKQPRAMVTAGGRAFTAAVKLLHRHGADLNASWRGYRALHSLLQEEPHADFARGRDAAGLTALQCVAGSRMAGAPLVAIAEMLLDAGAEIAALTKSWQHEIDAVYLAASAKNKPLFELFLDRGADATAALTPALWNGGLEFADAALAHGAVPDHAKSETRPLLNDLIRWGQMPQVFWLLANGASPNLPDERGWTAVHQAASRGNEKMWRAVLEAGGDVKKRDPGGDTPLDVAEMMGRTKLLRG